MKPEDVKAGDKLFIESSFYIDHGEDDVCGGLATVKEVFKDPKLPEGHFNRYMVSFEEISPETTKYNLRYLLEYQERFAEKYAGKVAHPCPDV